MEQIKLNPCRNCGGEAEFYITKETGDFTFRAQVRCRQCEQHIKILSVLDKPDGLYEKTADAWNMLQEIEIPHTMT